MLRSGGGPLAAVTCLLLASTALLACTATIAPAEQGSEPAASPGTSAATADTGGGVTALPASCHLQLAGALPDMACAPGAADPAVTQANIGSTICVSGYTTRVRPPVSYTDPIKTDLIKRYGLRGSASSYELDHLVPLEVGGAPRSVHNLWPEPRDQHPGASEKDHLENVLHDRVCQGRTPLADAQRMFEQNWVDAWRQLGLN